MAVETNIFEFSIGDRLDVRIFISSKNKYFDIDGQVVRVNKLVSNHFIYGIKFMDIEPEAGKELINILSWKCTEY